MKERMMPVVLNVIVRSIKLSLCGLAPLSTKSLFWGGKKRSFSHWYRQWAKSIFCYIWKHKSKLFHGICFILLHKYTPALKVLVACSLWKTRRQWMDTCRKGSTQIRLYLSEFTVSVSLKSGRGEPHVGAKGVWFKLLSMKNSAHQPPLTCARAPYYKIATVGNHSPQEKK